MTPDHQGLQGLPDDPETRLLLALAANGHPHGTPAVNHATSRVLDLIATLTSDRLTQAAEQYLRDHTD